MIFFFKKLSIFYVFSLFLTFFTHPLHSAIIKKQKNKKVLILMEEGESLKKGDQLYALDEDNKKKAIVQILKVKNNKAIGKVKKGITKRGWALVLKSEYSKYSQNNNRFLSSKKAELRKSFSFLNQKFLFGILGGYNLFNFNIEAKDGKKSKMSGPGYSVKGTFHYRPFSSLYTNTGVGYKTLLVKSNVKHCKKKDGQNAPCETAIGYLTVDVRGQFVFFRNYRMRPWIGGGVDFYFPLYKDSVEPNENVQGQPIGSSFISKNTITNTSVYLGMAGLDISITRKIIFSIAFEYGLFPSSETIKGNSMSIIAGFLF